MYGSALFYRSLRLGALAGVVACVVWTANGEEAPSIRRLTGRANSAPEARQSVPVLGWSETLTEPRPLRIHFLRVDLRDPRIEPCVVVAPDPDGKGPAEAVLTAPQTLAGRAPGLLAAVNANAFSYLADPSALERLGGWIAGKPVDMAGLVVVDGVVRSAGKSGRVPFWFDAARAPHLGAPARGVRIEQAVADWGTLLVTGGKVIATPNTTLHPRTLAGFDPSRRWLLLAVIDGRWAGVSEGMSLRESAALMKSRGCSEAVNLDGGGSSILLQREPDQPGLKVINHPSDGRPRPIPVMLGIRERRKSP